MRPVVSFVLAAVLGVVVGCRAPGNECVNDDDCTGEAVCSAQIGGALFRPKICVPPENAVLNDTADRDSSPLDGTNDVDPDLSPLDATNTRDTEPPPPDAANDRDRDGIADDNDNCPRIANPDQEAVRGICEFDIWKSRAFSASTQDVLVGDFAGDDKSDLMRIVSDKNSPGGTLEIYVGTPDSTLKEPRRQPLPRAVFDAGDAGTVNGFDVEQVLNYDGVDKSDVIIEPNFDIHRPKWPYLLLRNDGTGVFTAEPLDLPRRRFMAALELNGDAYPDVISAGRKKVYYTASDGNGGWSKPVALTSPDFGREVEIVDVDLDGDLDLLSSNIYVWLENSNDGSRPTVRGEIREVPNDSEPYKRFETGTFDGDDDVDILKVKYERGGYPIQKGGPRVRFLGREPI